MATYSYLDSASSSIDRDDIANILCPGTPDVPLPLELPLCPPNPAQANQHNNVAVLGTPPKGSQQLGLYTVKVNDDFICNVYPTSTTSHHMFQMYMEQSNNNNILAGKLNAAQNELLSLKHDHEKKNLEIALFQECLGRERAEAWIAKENMSREMDEMKKQFDEYKECTKALVGHLRAQQKKAKKAPNQ